MKKMFNMNILHGKTGRASIEAKDAHNKNKIYNVTNKYCGFFGSIRKCIKKGV